MIKRLIGFRIISFFRPAALILRIRVRAVLAEADSPVRVLSVIIIQKFIVLFQFTEIPAKIQVIAVHIRNFQNRAVRFQHENVGHRRGACLIHPVTQLLQQPVVLQKVLVDRTGRGNFIAQSPDSDGRMVIALGNQLFHLMQRIFPSVPHVHGNIGNLRPDDNAVFIT